MSNFSNLVELLEKGNQQLIDLVASQIFFDKKGMPREDQIRDFVKQNPGIPNYTTYIEEVGIYVGTIVYKGKAYYYSPYLGKEK